MSGKETVIQWVHELPEDLGIQEILAELQDRLATELLPPECATVDYEWPAEDLTDDEWRQVVARSFHELADPREDLYTLEDGSPEDGQR
jgi:hypothetical protein